MPQVRLPDGTTRQYDAPITVAGVAESIAKSLAKAALAAKVDGKLVDCDFVVSQDAELQIITDKDDDGLEIIRHSTAHLLAQAIKTLFPEAQIAIGPVIEDGFYYDLSYKRALTPEDLSALEKQMHELVKQNHSISHRELSRDEAIKLFEEMGEHYKVEIVKDIPANDRLSVYQQGDFVDLCRGPHVPRTGLLKAFKLLKLAGAYWRGNSDNEMLQRIYGTAWQDKNALSAYIKRIEEAEKRDHRKLAKKMDLFHFQQEAPGMVFWHPKGWQIVLTMREYLRKLNAEAGYQEVNTPQLVNQVLWEKSGHAAKFDDGMFVTESEARDYIVKPMNCPCHVQIFKQGLHSYKSLPIRYAEYGSCHRNEPSGALHGLLRVRAFVQDDGHIFCTEDQIMQEAEAFCGQLFRVYKDFGYEDIIVKLATRPEKRVGSDETWDKTEAILAKSLDNQGLEWEYNVGEGAFYGPKIEFALRDCLGRVWQCGTLQLDSSMPERLGAYYIADDNSKQVPYMLHRAILGSFERFLGILIENYAGKLPLWLAPEQAVVMNISDNQRDYALKVRDQLKNLGLRVNSDLRNEKIGFKIREHTIARVPFQIILGDKEVESGTISVRDAEGKQTNDLTVDAFVDSIKSLLQAASLNN